MSVDIAYNATVVVVVVIVAVVVGTLTIVVLYAYMAPVRAPNTLLHCYTPSVICELVAQTVATLSSVAFIFNTKVISFSTFIAILFVNNKNNIEQKYKPQIYLFAFSQSNVRCFEYFPHLNIDDSVNKRYNHNGNK